MRHKSILGRKVELKPLVTLETLKENKTICAICNGVGWLLEDNKYLIACQHCYNGVNNKCDICNNPIIRPNYRCQNINCIAELDRRRIDGIINKAVKLKYEDPKAKEFTMMYSDYYKSNEGYFSDWDDFFENWYEYHKDDDKPKYVFGTEEIKLSIDADSILSNACDDLHEDAYDRLEDINELQELLDKWCEKQTGVTSYCEDYKYMIEIPWQWYK